MSPCAEGVLPVYFPAYDQYYADLPSVEAAMLEHAVLLGGEGSSVYRLGPGWDTYDGIHLQDVWYEYNLVGPGYVTQSGLSISCYVEVAAPPSGVASGPVTLAPVQFDALSAILIGLAVVTAFALGFSNGGQSV